VNLTAAHHGKHDSVGRRGLADTLLAALIAEQLTNPQYFVAFC